MEGGWKAGTCQVISAPFSSSRDRSHSQAQLSGTMTRRQRGASVAEALVVRPSSEPLSVDCPHSGHTPVDRPRRLYPHRTHTPSRRRAACLADQMHAAPPISSTGAIGQTEYLRAEFHEFGMLPHANHRALSSSFLPALHPRRVEPELSAGHESTYNDPSPRSTSHVEPQYPNHHLRLVTKSTEANTPAASIARPTRRRRRPGIRTSDGVGPLLLITTPHSSREGPSTPAA